MLVPPNFDPAPGFPEARATAASLKAALERADPGRVVYLSTIGAQGGESNLLTQHTIIERVLGVLPMPITSFDPPGSWRIFAGMSPRREKAGSS